MVPVANFLLGPKAVAPVISIGEELSRPVRLALFWRHIDWRVARYHIPGSMLGAFLGAYVFTQIDASWLQLILGLFLVSTVFQYRFGEKRRSFTMKLVYFLPLGFTVSLISALFGAAGPVETPFYLNYGLEKEAMIGTKTLNSFMAGLVQLGTYSFFGSLPKELWGFGIAIALGAAVGSYIGKMFLSTMSSTTFRRIVLAVMAVSGLAMIYRQLTELL
jgi:uncharacterized membrane protein YfcA